MNRWIVTLAAALLAAGAAQTSVAQGQGKDKGKDDNYNYGKQNHGQVVSDCAHRANERNLKGQERKDYTEWCQSRGPRYKYEYSHYSRERNCYEKANLKALYGDRRAEFLDRCFAERVEPYYGGKAPVKKKD